MTMEYHVNISREEMETVVAVADENGEIVAIEVFRTIHTDRTMSQREFRALAWTMGVLLRQAVPGCRTAVRGVRG